MNRKTKASEVMTFPVHTVRPGDPLRKVIALLCRYRISGIPVVDGKGRLVGLISERDILEAMYPNKPELRQRRPRLRIEEGVREIGSITAQEIMVRDVVTATPNADLLRLASLMAARRFRRIPIVEDKRLVGIVSQGDVYRGIFERGRSLSEPAGVAAPAPILRVRAGATNSMTEEERNGVLSRYRKSR